MVGEWPKEMMPVSNMIQATIAKLFFSFEYKKEAKLLERVVWAPVLPVVWAFPLEQEPRPTEDGIYVIEKGQWLRLEWY